MKKGKAKPISVTLYYVARLRFHPFLTHHCHGTKMNLTTNRKEMGCACWWGYRAEGEGSPVPVPPMIEFEGESSIFWGTAFGHS